MKTISEYKNMALGSLEGKWTKAAVASLIAFLMASSLSSYCLLPGATSFISCY